MATTKSKAFAWILILMTIYIPNFTKCQSRGEGLWRFPVQRSQPQSINNHTCGFVKNEEFSSRIQGGYDFERGEWPWTVALINSKTNKFFCSGTFISGSKVVTAAHCVSQKFDQEVLKPEDIKLLFGAYDLENPMERGTYRIQPKQIVIHPAWNVSNPRYDADLALIIPDDDEVIPRTKFISPICLWESSEPPTHSKGFIAGWGSNHATHSFKGYEPIPQQLELPIVSQEECLLSNRDLVDISSNRTFCAGSRNNRGPCQGDSGGGMFMKVNDIFYLRGIVSSGLYDIVNQTCDVNNFAVYTNALKFTDWIKEDHESIKKKLNFDQNASFSLEGFSLKLLATFQVQLREDNFMISPFSIYHMLAMISEGARGDTFEELKQMLSFSSLKKARDFQKYLNMVLEKNTADVRLRKFAMLVVDENRPINREFENLIEKVYESDVEPINFLRTDESLYFINNKISNLTEGQITDTLMKDDLFKAQLILISGLFFKGSWMNVFNTSFTKREPFYNESGNQIGEVNMMYQRGLLPYAAVAEIGCHVLELPYAEKTRISQRIGQAEYRSEMSMIVMLPRKGISLEEALRKIYEEGMIKIYKELYNAKNENNREEIEVHLPRFEIESSLDLKQTLIYFGIEKVFRESADLGNINRNFFVSSMIHKTKMTVDEKGDTQQTISHSRTSRPLKFKANKPFLFFIVDKTNNLILLSGQYAVPELY